MLKWRFDAYERCGGARARTGEGGGLGLAPARGVRWAMEGLWWMEEGE